MQAKVIFLRLHGDFLAESHRQNQFPRTPGLCQLLEKSALSWKANSVDEDPKDTKKVGVRFPI